MTAPRTILDERFSDAGAEPTDWGFTLGTLESAELLWLSTVRADGRPHVTPLVAVWTEDRLHFCGKKKTGAHYLVVEAPGEERVLMAIDPKLGAAARKFALKVDYLAGTQGVYAS